MNYTLLSNSDLSGLTKQYVESSMHLPHCLVVWFFSSPPTFASIFYNQYSKGPWIFPWGGQKPILLPGRDDSGWDSRGRQFRPLAATARWSRANFLKWQGKPSWIAKICWKIIRYNKIFTSVYICIHLSISNLALPVGAITFHLSRAAVCSGGSGGISPPIHSVDSFKRGRGTTKEIFLVSFPPNEKILCKDKIARWCSTDSLCIYVWCFPVDVSSQQLVHCCSPSQKCGFAWT